MDITVISLESIEKIHTDMELEIKVPDLTCRAAGGQPMALLGKTCLNVNINGKNHQCMFYIIDLLCQGLIGLRVKS